MIEEFKQELSRFEKHLNYEKRSLSELMKEVKVEEMNVTFRYDFWDKDYKFIQYLKLRHGAHFTYIVHENKREDTFTATLYVSGVQACELTVRNASEIAKAFNVKSLIEIVPLLFDCDIKTIYLMHI